MLEFKNVNVAGADGAPVGPLSVVVERGEVVCLCGDRVCGSGLLPAILGLQPLFGGYITVEGEPVVPGSATYFRQQMAYVPGNVPRGSWSVERLCHEMVALKAHSGLSADRAVLATHWRQLGLSTDLFDKSTQSLDATTLQLVMLSMVPLLRRPIVLVDRCPQGEAVGRLLRQIADAGAEVVYTCETNGMACDKMVEVSGIELQF